MPAIINLLVVLLCLGSPTVLLAQINIVAHGIPDSLYDRRYAELANYRSQVNYPPFIGWSANGRKMLFNGGQVIYSMRKYSAEIKSYQSAERNFTADLSPDHTAFLYQEDQDGNEDYQLFLYDVASETSTPLSKQGDKTYDPFWSSDNSRIAYKSNKADAARVDLYLKSLSGSHTDTLVFEGFTDDGQVYDWSAAKHLLLAATVISENDKRLYLIDDRSYEVEPVNPSADKIAYANPRFIPGQDACLIVSDQSSEFLQLHHYDLATKAFTTITSDIPWDVEAITLDRRGRKAAFSVNADGLSQLYILDIPTLKYRKVGDLPAGVIADLIMNPDGTEVGFNFYSGTFRRKVYGYDLKRGALRQYTRKGSVQADSVAFVPAEAFRFTSRDAGRDTVYHIPAYIYRAAGESSPVFIDIHGGPEYQIRPRFDAFYQYLVKELGITVVVPNIRGSNGYGKSYMQMDDGLKRERVIQDVGALLDWIELQDGLDENRVAIHGESYGGYVVLASLARYSDRINCGIDAFGISNWITYLERTRDYRRDLRRVEFGDERNPEIHEFLERISPVSQVDDISAPLLIFQGQNDPRVDYREAEQMYTSLRDQGNKVWYVLAKDEGHGFHKADNYDLQVNLTISFLKKHLSIAN